jgi:3,4-dihydroxy 2-butanone 4-phosphate synthase/GTP cyclohydrolase II
MILFSKIEDIIKDAKKGKMFILVDDEKRENEGDLVVPAQNINSEKINFMAKYGRGLICLALTGKRIEELNLPLMPQHNAARRKTAFTISIEAKRGISTGISAKDRAKTIKVAINKKTNSKDISTPGHIFPLRAQDGGVLVRAGHTEAAIDIAELSNLNPSGVICEIMNDDGTMARRDDLFKFSKEHKLRIATISDLISYRRKKEKIIERTLKTKIKSQYGGQFDLIVYKNKVVPAEHIALVKGKINLKKPVLVRVHALNFLTDILGTSLFVDNQIKKSMRMISKKKNGVIVIIREPRSWTLSQRIKSNVDDKKNLQLRDYGIGAQILIDLGIKKMILISNSKKTIVGLEGYGLKVVNTIPIK